MRSLKGEERGNRLWELSKGAPGWARLEPTSASPGLPNTWGNSEICPGASCIQTQPLTSAKHRPLQIFLGSVTPVIQEKLTCSAVCEVLSWAPRDTVTVTDTASPHPVSELPPVRLQTSTAECERLTKKE